jgi:VIT1/CCC1 family predicted Fe2+/Mn2+ transporter
MAAGEYVSVSSQEDTEQAELTTERRELETEPQFEEQELAGIYEKRGLDRELAATVARQLMKHDALAAHARDELGLSDALAARPLQAALSSAATFTVGAVLPILTAMFSPVEYLEAAVSGASLICLVILGAIAAYAGGASPWKGAARVGFWGAIAMAVTAAVGSLFGTPAS